MSLSVTLSTRLFLPMLVKYQLLFGPDVEFEPHNAVSDKLGRYVIILGRLYKSLVVFVMFGQF